jgi:hypothetical protein
MNCYQCNTHFCYLCSSWLDPQNPYQHFNAPGKPCYQRLWELEEGDDGEGNVQFVGVRGWEAEAIAAAAAEADAEAAGNPAPQQAGAQAAHQIPPPAPEPILVALAQMEIVDMDQEEFPEGIPIAMPVEDSDSDFDEEDLFPWRWEAQPAFERRQPGRPHQPRRPALGGAPVRRGPVAPGLRAGRALVAVGAVRDAREIGAAGVVLAENQLDHEVEVDEGADDWNHEDLGEPIAEERPAFVIREARRQGRRRGGGQQNP